MPLNSWQMEGGRGGRWSDDCLSLQTNTQTITSTNMHQMHTRHKWQKAQRMIQRREGKVVHIWWQPYLTEIFKRPNEAATEWSSTICLAFGFCHPSLCCVLGAKHRDDSWNINWNLCQSRNPPPTPRQCTQSHSCMHSSLLFKTVYRWRTLLKGDKWNINASFYCPNFAVECWNVDSLVWFPLVSQSASQPCAWHSQCIADLSVLGLG